MDDRLSFLLTLPAGVIAVGYAEQDFGDYDYRAKWWVTKSNKGKALFDGFTPKRLTLPSVTKQHGVPEQELTIHYFKGGIRFSCEHLRSSAPTTRHIKQMLPSVIEILDKPIHIATQERRVCFAIGELGPTEQTFPPHLFTVLPYLRYQFG